MSNRVVHLSKCGATLFEGAEGSRRIVVRDKDQDPLAGGSPMFKKSPMGLEGDIKAYITSVVFTPEVLPILGDSITEKSLSLILDERKRQDAKWGGSDHDDSHSVGEWLDLIQERVNEIKETHNHNAIHVSESQRLLVEIAAISSAAVEAMIRASHN